MLESKRENNCQLFENDRGGSDGKNSEKQRSKRDREKWGDEEGKIDGEKEEWCVAENELVHCLRPNGGSDSYID